jgi:CDP-diacylglycerol--glycerol-3-phosphate 3-phosphatidyltransferase
MIDTARRFLERHRNVNHRDPSKLYPHDRLLAATLIPLIPRQVHPNHITVLRLFMIPIVLLFLAVGEYAIGVPLFFFAAFTDALDGSLARVRKQITDWGTFYDPVADKILIGSVVLLIVVRYINVWFGLLIVLLELLIIAGGYARKRQGHLTTANVFGKTKMFLQVMGVLFVLIAVWMGEDLFLDISVGTLALAILFAVLSLFTYGL